MEHLITPLTFVGGLLGGWLLNQWFYKKGRNDHSDWVINDFLLKALTVIQHMVPNDCDSVRNSVHDICCLAGVLAAFDDESARQLWKVASDINQEYLGSPLDKNYDDVKGEAEKISFLKRTMGLLRQVRGEYVRLHD